MSEKRDAPGEESARRFLSRVAERNTTDPIERISTLVESDVLAIFRRAIEPDEDAWKRVALALVEAIRGASDEEIEALVPALRAIQQQFFKDEAEEHLVVLWDRLWRALGSERADAALRCRDALLGAPPHHLMQRAHERRGILWSADALRAYDKYIEGQP